MREYYIAWWNLENLFDVENAPQRPGYLQTQLAGELAGWNQQILDAKVAQLASVIKSMNGGAGPDVLGVCEIENDNVVNLLVNALGIANRNYAVAHHDMSDKRGIDIAFIYDSNLFRKTYENHHVVLKRSATRDLYQINLETLDGNEFYLVGNHWPSRSAGTYESEPYRIIAGETLAYWHKRIMEIKGADSAVIAMGDFNDDTCNRAITDYALSTRSRRKVSYSTIVAPRFFNMMWGLQATGIASYYFDNFPIMFDQFLVSKGLVKQNGVFTVVDGSAEVIRPLEMRTGGYEVPRRFGRPSKSLDLQGFSDHYPVCIRIRERT